MLIISRFGGYDTAFRAEQSVDYWATYKYQNNIFTNEVYDGYVDPAHSMWWAPDAPENKKTGIPLKPGSPFYR